MFASSLPLLLTGTLWFTVVYVSLGTCDLIVTQFNVFCAASHTNCGDKFGYHTGNILEFDRKTFFQFKISILNENHF